MNLLFAAQSGWGKSYHAQAWMERNAAAYDALVVLDYCAEYRGLVKEGLADHLIVGGVESQYTPNDWRVVLQDNPYLVLERHKAQTPTDRWRAICTDIAQAVRSLNRDQLVVVDEAHFVAPEHQLPQPVKELGTTGRGAGTSSMWVTQRLTEMANTISTQCQARMLGGFESGDLGRVSVEYPTDLHDNTADPSPSRVPDDLLPEGRERPTSLQKHEDDAGNTIGSEWIYSDDDGEKERVNTQNVHMDSTHYGQQGNDLEKPTYA